MIEAVTGLTVLDRATGAPVPGFQGFLRSDRTTESFAAAIPSPDLPNTLRWYGFQSEVGGAIEPGVEVEYVFEIQLKEDACRGWKKKWKRKKCKRRIAKALSFALIGHDASNPDGSLAFRHLGFQTVRNPPEKPRPIAPGPF